jgi:hypothetical protein
MLMTLGLRCENEKALRCCREHPGLPRATDTSTTGSLMSSSEQKLLSSELANYTTTTIGAIAIGDLQLAAATLSWADGLVAKRCSMSPSSA